jgi:hypothetical protein
MGNLSALIDELRNEDLQGLESLETMDNNELSHYLRQVGLNNLPTNEARALIRSMKPNAPAATMVDSFRAPVSAAIFDITISRNSANIAASLPLPIFGVLDRESNYVEIISQDLPAGTVLTSIALTPSGKGLRFTYTSGLNVDSIDIECAQVPYVNILRAAQTSLLKMQQNKMQISDVTLQSQFSQKVGLVVNTIFGKNTSDSFTPNQFKSDLQNQNDIRTITWVADIDSETSLTFQVIPQVFSITWTSYIQKFETNRAKGF